MGHLTGNVSFNILPNIYAIFIDMVKKANKNVEKTMDVIVRLNFVSPRQIEQNTPKRPKLAP